MEEAALAASGTEGFKANGLELATIDPLLSRMASGGEHSSWQILAHLRVTLRASVSLRRFRVKDLLAMREGQVFETSSPTTEDVPLMVGQVQLGWSEFEAVEQRMALRLTRLS